MKKTGRFLVFAFILCALFIGFKVEAKDKVNIYFFRGEGCPHCAEAEEWFETLSKDEEYSKYYEIVDYEVWYSKDNAKLMEKVAKKLGTEANGVPFIVIGEKYFSGYASSMNDEIKSTIKKAYEGDNYKDVVKQVVENKTTTKKDEKKSPLIPIVIVSVIAVFTVVAMVFFTKEK